MGRCTYFFAFLLIVLGHSLAFSEPSPQDLSLFFAAPAEDWESEGLPIGNGAMGAVITGGIGKEIIQFNEKTLWEGGPGSIEGYDFGWPEGDQVGVLREVQKHIFDKGSLAPERAAELMGRDTKGYGHYQSFGQVEINHQNIQIASNYRRELDLSTGVVSISYQSDGVNYTREYFASYPAGVLVARFRSEKPNLALDIRLTVPDNRVRETSVGKNKITVRGKLNDNNLKNCITNCT